MEKRCRLGRDLLDTRRWEGRREGKGVRERKGRSSSELEKTHLVLRPRSTAAEESEKRCHPVQGVKVEEGDGVGGKGRRES